MIMNILNWIFFIAALMGYMISLVASFISSNEHKSSKTLLCNLTNYLSFGLIFYTIIHILNGNTVFIILLILIGISIIVSLYTIYKFIWDIYRASTFYRICAIVILCILITTVIILLKIDVSSIVSPGIHCSYKSITPIIEIFLIGWIPLTVLLFIYWKINNKQVSNTYDKNAKIENIIYSLYVIYQNSCKEAMPLGYLFEKANMYIRNQELDSDISLSILRNFETLIDREIRRPIPLNEFKNILLYGINSRYNDHNYNFENTYYLEAVTERVQTILRKELSRNNRYKNFDNNEIHEINVNIEQLKDLILQTVKKPHKMGFDSKDDFSSLQQQFIKELFHCLMTPISQVDASLSTVKAKLSTIDADDVLERSLKSIQAGIKLTKSVLYAYRQVAYYTFNNVSEDTLTIKEGIDSAELLYQGHSKKQLVFNNQNIPDSVSGFSNYFILATILPLLENAICATESSQQISVEYKSVEQDHIFKISNPCNTPINIKNLYKDGFSSKNEKGKPHIGTGLAIVRNLIGKIDNSTLEFELSNNILSAILKIHKNEIQDRNLSN